MASPSTQFGSTQQDRPACEVLPVPPDRQLPSHLGLPSDRGRAERHLAETMNDHIAWMRDVAQAYTELASEAVHYAKLSAVRSWYRARAGTARSYARAAHSTDEIVSRTRDKARFMQREQPVRVLAIVAGAAVVAGIATRIWRSQSYES